MVDLGCDYSWEHPEPLQISNVGYKFVMRYLSFDGPPKNATRQEIDALHAAGLSVGFVWESTGLTPEGGAAAGNFDGSNAGAQANALGIPPYVPIFWALDTDDRGIANWQAELSAYNAAFARASGRHVMPYGSSRVIFYFGAGWQTEAWSNGEVSSKALIYQRASGAKLAGTDEDLLLNPAGGWCLWPALGQAPPLQPITQADRDTIKYLQKVARVNPDGVWGPVTDNALMAIRWSCTHPYVREDVRCWQIQGALHVSVRDAMWGPTTDFAFGVARLSYLNR